MIKNRLIKLSLLTSALILVCVSTLPGVSADTQALPTLRITLGAGGAASTAAAAATKLAGTASVAATKVAGTATTLAGTAAALATKAAVAKTTLTPPVATGAQAATDAITSYASSVLGITVTVKKAGGLSGDINKALSQSPKGSAAQLSAVNLAVISYGAILTNGAASLSYGSGTVTGDVTVDVQGSSLGVYSLATTYSGTLDANAALALAKKTFPNLSGFSYTAQTVTKGFAWYAKGNIKGFNTQTKKFETMAEAVILYILPTTTGKATVTATVGRGTFATAVKP
jgi:hypothetical protein